MNLKRTTYLILSVLLTISLLACSKKNSSSSQSSQAVMDNGREIIGNTYSSGLPIVKNPETFKVAIYRHTQDRSKSYAEKLAFIKAQTETGVNIEWIELVAGTEIEKTNIMLASDLPDAFIHLVNEEMLAKNTGSFINLDKDGLLRKYAPNVVKQYEAEIPNVWDTLRFPDGAIYSLMTGVQTNYEQDGEGIQIINKAWVEKVGKKLPTTLEEYFDVMKAIRDGDPNGNGLKDEIPVEFTQENWAATILNFAGPWGIAADRASVSEQQFFYFRVKNGKVEPTINTKAFRDFLEFYHRMAEEKLIDVEGFSQTNQQYFAKCREYVVGSHMAWTFDGFIPDKAGEFVVLPPISAPGYQYAKTGQLDRLRGNRTGFAITTACKNPAALLRWWDYLSGTTEIKYLTRYGEEGNLWERDSSGKVWTIFPENESADFNREIKKYTWGAFNYEPLVMKSEMEQNDPIKYPKAVARSLMVDQVKNYLLTEVVPMRFVSPEKISERSFIETELISYMNGFIARSILNGLTEAGWQAHLKQLDSLNFPAWIRWYQDLVDNKL
ncbi:ABC transporter substrate-binding protein [Spirochaetia bacterium]|nr:ABC transporter substrate-binding protein [Spirochaetia bacterium]